MNQANRTEASPAGESGVRRILVVTPVESAPPSLHHAAEPTFDVTRVHDLAEAVQRLGAQAIDVVIVDAKLAAAEPAQLEPLRAALGPKSLLVRAEPDAPELVALLDRLDRGACLLPATMPENAQAQLVALAAERAQLAATLDRRIAELEQRTHELVQSRARFRDVIERNADAIVVVDRDGAIRFANDAAARLFDSARDELSDSPFGFPILVGETTELDLVHESGRRVVEMRVVESEWEDRPAYIATLRDITERKRAEQAAHRLVREQAARTAAETAAKRSQFLVEATTLLTLRLDLAETLSTLAELCATHVADWAVVYIVDDGGRVQRLAVAHRDPAKAETVRALRTDTIEPRGPHPVHEVLRTGEPMLATHVDEAVLATLAQDAQHYALLRQLGVASFMIVPLIARDRKLGAIALVSADAGRQFTTQNLAEANDLALRAALAVDNARLYHAAQDANQAKSDLLAVISHDLRTPLNAIMGHAELLALGVPEPVGAAALERIQRIRTSAKHLIYLIDELLTFTRLEAGREKLHLEQVDAATIAHEVGEVVEPLALERGLAFHIVAPADGAPLRTDAGRLRQVLLNLVGNAVKYTPCGEVRLELASAPDTGNIVFHVRDTGVGIRLEDLDHIFEPFWQVDGQGRSANEGAGLGLSIVRRLVELLDGEVSVSSRVGMGSTFTVELPSLDRT